MTIEESLKILNDGKSGRKYTREEAVKMREILSTIIQVERNNAKKHYEKIKVDGSGASKQI
jgi:hypothetical protein